MVRGTSLASMPWCAAWNLQHSCAGRQGRQASCLITACAGGEGWRPGAAWRARLPARCHSLSTACTVPVSTELRHGTGLYGNYLALKHCCTSLVARNSDGPTDSLPGVGENMSLGVALKTLSRRSARAGGLYVSCGEHGVEQNILVGAGGCDACLGALLLLTPPAGALCTIKKFVM